MLSKGTLPMDCLPLEACSAPMFLSFTSCSPKLLIKGLGFFLLKPQFYSGNCCFSGLSVACVLLYDFMLGWNFLILGLN